MAGNVFSTIDVDMLYSHYPKRDNSVKISTYAVVRA